MSAITKKRYARFDQQSVTKLRDDLRSTVKDLLEKGGALQASATIGRMTYAREGGQVEFKMTLQLKPPEDERDADKISFDANAVRWNSNHKHQMISRDWHGRIITYDSVKYIVAEVHTSCSKRPVLCKRIGGGQGLKVPPLLLRKILNGETVTGAAD